MATPLDKIQRYMGGDYTEEQRERVRRQGVSERRARSFGDDLVQGRMLPLDIEAQYDASPLGLTRAPQPDPGSMRAIVDDDTMRGALYGLIEPAMTRNIPEGRAEGLINWRNWVGGYADMLGKTLSKSETPSIGDYLMASFDAASLGFPKIMTQYVKNLRNYVPGFYSGQQALGAGRNALFAGVETTKDFAQQLYRDVPISKGTENTLREELAKYRELRQLGRDGGFTDEIIDGMRSSARKIHGQIGQNIVHGRMMGESPEVLRGWAEKNFGEELPFDRSLANEMFDDVDAELIYDMSNEAWGGVSGGYMGKAKDALFINKKNTRVAGNSFNDIVSSRQFKTLRRLNAKHSPKSAEEWLRVLDEYDPDWSKNLAIPRKSVVQGTEGVLFQFSPAGKQDYLLGGFNAIIKVNKDGTAKMFGTDKQDIFNFKIPGGADAIVGIGNQKAVNFGGPKDTTSKRLSNRPIPKYKPPKKRETGEEVTLEKAKETQASSNKRKEYNYLSDKDERILDSILGTAGGVSPSRIGASGSVAAALGIIGTPYEE